MFKVEHSQKIPQYLIDEGENQIRDLLDSVNGVRFVMLCSSDGFELALVSKKT